MKIEKGISRIAIVGKRVTLKFPQVHVGRTIRAIIEAIKHNYLRGCLASHDKYYASLSSHLLKGWLENMREWRLSQEISDIVVPTRFSIFGLMNIQDTATDANLPYAAIASALVGKIPNGIILAHGAHTIAGDSNFGLHKGELKLRDYGELGLDYLLRNHGDQIKQALTETMAKNHAR